ncbi:MAG: hypothetical protein IJI97_04845, partial [Clostridia bacterium]|nr:hypothetical protein [Clostridia bacterium]
MEKRNQAAKLLIGAAIVLFAVLLIGGVVGGKNLVLRIERTTPLTRADVTYQTVDDLKASSKDKKILNTISSKNCFGDKGGCSSYINIRISFSF